MLKKERPKKNWEPLKYGATTLFFLAPWLLVFLIFQLFPIGYSLWIAFTQNTTLGSPSHFVGGQNFVTLSQDEDFLKSLQHSLLFLLGTVPFTIVLALVTAFLLKAKTWGRTFFQLAFFAPSITSLFVIANLFSQLYGENGFFNTLLVIFGHAPILWLKNIHFALPAIMVMNVWASFGFYALLFLSSLQGIPKEYYELAMLEGFSRFKQVISISLPLLWPIIKLAFLLNAILAFQVFGEVYVMTQGGPVKSTETAVFYIFDQAFSERNFGLSSAAAYIVFLLLLVFSLLKNVSPKRILGKLRLKPMNPLL